MEVDVSATQFATLSMTWRAGMSALKAGHCLQGIPNDLHQELLKHVGRDSFAERAMLSLRKLSAGFKKSCADCAVLFAGKQQEVSSTCAWK